ncbi:Glycoside hydrolase, family 28 [Dillenia turbinata]|uniref:Glycoside hydrolase, family 28 n=1 Tax=Dillenia turbinata TaxID=194707 RepID=A0AAN8VT97_9MAGN
MQTQATSGVKGPICNIKDSRGSNQNCPQRPQWQNIKAVSSCALDAVTTSAGLPPVGAIDEMDKVVTEVFKMLDASGGRYASLIFGNNLTDVVITGKLKYTRPYLFEITYSENIQISNLTLFNSPSWHVHPVYGSNIPVQGLIIIAPVTVPNTDGINPVQYFVVLLLTIVSANMYTQTHSDFCCPDSCTNTRIEDCYILKSGWDEYGVALGMPTKQLVIRRLTCISPDSAVIALGSEMSGGIQDVRAEDILAINSESGVRIKTAIGRGGYVKDKYVRRMTMKTMKWAFWMTGNYGSHADENYDPNALPVIQGINYRDMVAENVTMAARLEGISGDPFIGICISNKWHHTPKKYLGPALMLPEFLVVSFLSLVLNWWTRDQSIFQHVIFQQTTCQLRTLKFKHAHIEQNIYETNNTTNFRSLLQVATFLQQLDEYEASDELLLSKIQKERTKITSNFYIPPPYPGPMSAEQYLCDQPKLMNIIFAGEQGFSDFKTVEESPLAIWLEHGRSKLMKIKLKKVKHFFEFELGKKTITVVEGHSE